MDELVKKRYADAFSLKQNLSDFEEVSKGLKYFTEHKNTQYNEERNKELFKQLSEAKEGKEYLVIRNKIVEENLQLVRMVLMELISRNKYNNYNKYIIPSTINADIFSVACEGLINSVDKYDISKECSFATYAMKNMFREIIKYWTKQTTKQRSVATNIVYMDTLPLFQLDNNDYASEKENLDIEREYNAPSYQYFACQSAEDEMLRFELLKKQQTMGNLILNEIKGARLSGREEEILIEYYGLQDNLPKTFKQISENLGISKQCCQKYHEAALLKINNYIIKNKGAKKFLEDCLDDYAYLEEEQEK